MASSDAILATFADGVTTVTVRGDFDLTLGGEFVAVATGSAGAAGVAGAAGCIEVDLAQVTLLDSAGLSALAQVGVAAREHGGTLRVVALSPIARRVIEICKMDEFLGLPSVPSP